MSSSCIEEVSVPDDNQYRIASELLSRAGIVISGSAPTDIRVKNPDFFRHVLQEDSLELGESYMDGWWECDRLDIFFSKVLRVGLENRLPHHFKDTLRIVGVRLFNLQSKKRVWIVSEEHYDLGNDLSSRMPDPFVQHSCAYWKDADNLESVQQTKLEMTCEELQLKSGARVLNIGCGWGGLAYYMAPNYDVSVVGVTISAGQQKMAQECYEGPDVTILLQDYRDLNDQFDRIASVGMFEHVGPKNYDAYFAVVSRNLKPEGVFLLYTIGSKKTDLNVDPWINEYISPNGYPPSVHQIAQSSEPYFVVEDWHDFGVDYDTTLMARYGRFLAAQPEITSNYSERPKRMFTYYLNACVGAFRARDIQLWQVVFSRGVENGLRVAH